MQDVRTPVSTGVATFNPLSSTRDPGVFLTEFARVARAVWLVTATATGSTVVGFVGTTRG